MDRSTNEEFWEMVGGVDRETKMEKRKEDNRRRLFP
jgi:hypothetical protein